MRANPFTNQVDPTASAGSLQGLRRLRKGIVGDWRNHFTAEQNRRFDAVWDEKMRHTALWGAYAPQVWTEE
jgi:hypothetical protein